MFEFFKTSQRLTEMDKQVSSSFAKVKEDTDALHQWVNYLHHQNQQLVDENAVLRRLVDEQKMALNEVKVTVQHMPKTPAEIKHIVDSHYSFEPIMRRIKHIEQKLELLEMRREPRPQVRPLLPERPSVSIKPQTALKEKMMRKIARNSKDYIKNLILSLVHKYGKTQALQLREMVVDEQGLCSRSSFYRILEEMESDGTLDLISKGKHAVYVASHSEN